MLSLQRSYFASVDSLRAGEGVGGLRRFQRLLFTESHSSGEECMTVDEGELIRERKLADRTQPISGSHIGTQKTRSAAQPGKMKGADCELYPTILIERGRWFQTSKAHWRHEFITRA